MHSNNLNLIIINNDIMTTINTIHAKIMAALIKSNIIGKDRMGR